MSPTDAERQTTITVLYRQDVDALARVLSVLRRLRVQVEALSVIPAGEATARAVLLLRSPAYHAERAQALIARQLAVIEVIEIGTQQIRTRESGKQDTPAVPPHGASATTTHASEEGLNDGYDSL